MVATRKRSRQSDPTERRALGILAVLLIGGYFLVAYGPAYWEYIRVRSMVKEMADRCMLDGGADRSTCSIRTKRELIDILGRDDPSIEVDLERNEHTGSIALSCSYDGHVKLPGLGAPRVLHFSIIGTASQPDHGFNVRPAN